MVTAKDYPTLQDWIAWEEDARTRECPVCKVPAGRMCERYPGGVSRKSHAVRGKHHNGRRIP